MVRNKTKELYESILNLELPCTNVEMPTTFLIRVTMYGKIVLMILVEDEEIKMQRCFRFGENGWYPNVKTEEDVLEKLKKINRMYMVTFDEDVLDEQRTK